MMITDQQKRCTNNDLNEGTHNDLNQGTTSYNRACFQGRTLSETVHQDLCCVYIPVLCSYILCY